MKNTIPVVLVLLAEIFSSRNGQISPSFTQDASLSTTGFTYTVQVETRQVLQTHEAAGNIRPLTEFVIESKISAQVLDVSDSFRDRVLKDQILAHPVPLRCLDSFRENSPGNKKSIKYRSIVKIWNRLCMHWGKWPAEPLEKQSWI